MTELKTQEMTKLNIKTAITEVLCYDNLKGESDNNTFDLRVVFNCVTKNDCTQVKRGALNRLHAKAFRLLIPMVDVSLMTRRVDHYRVFLDKLIYAMHIPCIREQIVDEIFNMLVKEFNIDDIEWIEETRIELQKSFRFEYESINIF